MLLDPCSNIRKRKTTSQIVRNFLQYVRVDGQTVYCAQIKMSPCAINRGLFMGLWRTAGCLLRTGKKTAFRYYPAYTTNIPTMIITKFYFNERGIVASAAQNTPHMEMFFLIFWHQPQYMEMFFASSTTFHYNRVILTFLFRSNTT